jgi:hypothetical protein
MLKSVFFTERTIVDLLRDDRRLRGIPQERV